MLMMKQILTPMFKSWRETVKPLMCLARILTPVSNRNLTGLILWLALELIERGAEQDYLKLLLSALSHLNNSNKNLVV